MITPNEVLELSRQKVERENLIFNSPFFEEELLNINNISIILPVSF